MFFTSSEQRERLRFADASLNQAISTLGLSGLDEHIAAEYKSALSNILENLCFVPNVTHGTVRAPRKISEDNRVPIIPVFPGESVRFSSQYYLLPTESQILACREKLESLAAESRLSSYSFTALSKWRAGSRGQRSQLELAYPARSRAVVNTSPFHGLGLMDLQIIGGETLVYIHSRPKMLIPMLAGTVRKSPTTVIHEAVHIDQALNDPLVLASEANDDSWRRELEAHSIGAVIDMALLESGYRPSDNEEFDASYMSLQGRDVPMSTSILVDTLRIKTNEGGGDPFLPNDELRRRINDHGLDFSLNGGGNPQG